MLWILTLPLYKGFLPATQLCEKKTKQNKPPIF